MEGKTSTDMSYYDFLFTIQKIRQIEHLDGLLSNNK
jgi:hypothetical protein